MSDLSDKQGVIDELEAFYERGSFDKAFAKHRVAGLKYKLDDPIDTILGNYLSALGFEAVVTYRKVKPAKDLRA